MGGAGARDSPTSSPEGGLLLKTFWSEDNLEALAIAYENRARRGDSLENLEVTMQALAEQQGFEDPVTMDGIRWQIRKLRGQKRIFHYQDYVTGEDVDLVVGPRVDYIEAEGKDPTVTITSSRDLNDPVLTLDELLEIGGFPDDLDRFAVTSYRRNVWPTTAKDADGNLVSRNNFQVKVTFGLKKPIEALQDIQRGILEDIEDLARRTIPANYDRPDCPDGLRRVMFEPAVVDLHLGNLVWGKEAGEDWDMKIAETVFKQTVRSLITEAQDSRSIHIEEIVWLIGNDLLHADGKEAKTTAGTQLALDNRWPKLFRKAWELQEWAINELRSVAPVHCIVIPGNHDELSSFTVGEVLRALYRHTKDVTIDNGPKPRKYHSYGSTLIGYTHGNHERLVQLPALMHADLDAKPFLSGADYKEFHVGHYHHRKGMNFLPSHEDQRGVLVRVLPSVTATDDWHFQKGFVGAVKAAEGFLFDRDNGLIRVVHSQRLITLTDED